MRSNVYNKYIELKKEDNTKMYLFKLGMFYDFISDDAIEISKITTLKLTNHTKEVVKCGFPSNCLDKYMEIFSNLKIDVVIVNDTNNDLNNYLNKIKKINIDNLTPIESLEILLKLKSLL